MRTGGAADTFPAVLPRRWWPLGRYCCQPLTGWVLPWAHILRCGGAWDRPFADRAAADVAALQGADFPALTDEAAQAISAAILAARERQDSVGGITQTAVCGLPAGVGEPWFDSVESLLSHAIFSIGGVKGIEFGGGFSAVCGYGSAFNDASACGMAV